MADKKVPEGIMDTIRRLAEMKVERGCTPAEAAAAAAKLEELLERWQLTLFDAQTQKYEEEIEEGVIEFGRVLPQWTYALARACSRAHDCDYFGDYVYPPGQKARRVMRFVGHASDVQVSQYLFETLAKLLMEMADRDGRRMGRRHAELISFKCNFMEGAARVIGDRLWEERERARTADVPVQRTPEGIPICPAPDASASTALVLVKEQAVKEYMKAEHPDVTVKKARAHAYDHRGYEMGKKAGAEVPIHKGVGSADAPKQIGR